MRLPRLFAISDPARPHAIRADPTRTDGGAAPGDSGPASSLAGLADWCRQLAAAGVDGLQLRDRQLCDAIRLERALVARSAFPPPRVLLVNRRFDLALASGADGVQLPASGLPIAPIRSAAGATLLLGRSTHSIEEILRARDEGADFVLFGPVFSTPSKAGRIEPRGVSSLAAAVRVGLPVIAIGGIDAGNAAAVAASGAHGLAAIRLVSDPARDRDRILSIRALWPEG